MAAAGASPASDRRSPALGFVGLGAMGAPICLALRAAGHELLVHDIDARATERLREHGARTAGSAREVADTAEVVFTSLPTPAVLSGVVAGEGGVLSGSAVRTIVELSTVGVTAAEELAGAAGRRDVGYLDAPVSGGVAGAQARTLAVMAAGPDALFERVRPWLKTFGRSVFHVGERPGQGQLTKLLNNLLSATAVLATAEVTAVAAHAGLDLGTLLEVLNAGSGRNTATSGKFPNQVLTREFGSGFRLALMAKDVELCLAEARREHVPLLVGGLVQQVWTMAATQLGESADHTEIVRVVEQWSGVRIAAEDR